MPRFSIIVPVYNTAEYLPQCIDSVLSQSFRDFEVILIDDGSTDHSGAICDQYAAADERVKVCHQANGGASRARNLGLAHATGEFVLFLDSDDYYLSANMLAALADTDADVTCFRLERAHLAKDAPFAAKEQDKGVSNDELLYQLVKKKHLYFLCLQQNGAQATFV